MRCGAPVLAVIAAAAAASGCAAIDLGRGELARRADALLPFASAPADSDTGRCADRFAPGAVDLSRGWRRRATQIGPALFLGLRRPRPPWRFEMAREHARHLDPSAAEGLLAGGSDRYAALYVRLMIPPGRQVTVSVPRSHRRHVGLLPEVTRFGGYTPADGRRAIACHGLSRSAAGPTPELAWTATSVGFIVAGPRCVPVTVTQPRRPPVTRRVPFGVGSCGPKGRTGPYSGA